ncbi:transcription factor FAMA [Trifolium pratense]|uniref:transcription factor FAMA n=1 Tax=Trifolium pratense TaxID=57577 RepID=UPI001E691C04|nr:transcription factor FAMA [Trifolium pratense]XP_045807863.1 transcription factor FAMA [Trifolium pratense]
MEKDNDYTTPGFNTLDYTQDQQQYEQLMKYRVGETSGENNGMVVDNYMPQTQTAGGFYGANNSFDKMSFADVMQFAALNREESDPVYFMKFPVLNNKMENENLIFSGGDGIGENESRDDRQQDQYEEINRVSEENNNVSVQVVQENNKKRKRPRSVKTSEEVESQRMTHIAVERNRRKQMNEHLRVLRSLMPGSYVQRGDQASIIGGAIEFVRELEQLLQCLESQKRRRLLGEAQSKQVEDSAPFFPATNLPTNDQMKLVEIETGLEEETAESKSCLADVEVKLLGFDAMIKILSKRRPGQLIKIIAALEDMQLIILHTNITTIEQTVLYSFNVKVASDTRFTAEDIASSVQQILSFIHANTTTM